MQPDVRENAAERIEAAHAAIQRFLSASKTPVLLEPGEAQIPLVVDSYEIAYGGGRLTIQAWDRNHTVLRRVTRILQERTGQLDLETERFGKRTGKLSLLDTARPQSQTATRKGERLAYREVFRRSLSRQFAGWQISELSTDPDLHHSLSPAYARGFIKKGASGWAAIGAAPEALDVDGILTFGLIWLDYLAKRESRCQIRGLVLFIPDGKERTTCLRVRHFDSSAARVDVFRYADGFEQRVDLADYGNLDTQLTQYTSQFMPTVSECDQAISRVLSIPGAEAIECPDGSLSIRMRGLEFGRRKDGVLSFGLETKRVAGTSTYQEFESLGRHLCARRVCDADKLSPLYTKSPELWLESQVRRSLQNIDAALLDHPVYGQVPAFAGGERGVIDLLAADAAGRLTVIELKAAEDVHLPLQALDYWMRVNWHVARREFAAHGYFPSLQLASRPPRLLLVAPALSFHPTTETILKYFSPDIEVERIGVGMDWKRELQVAFRLTGSETRA